MKLNTDLGAIIKHFFELPDWKDRSLKLGGLTIAWLLALIIIYVITILTLVSIPILGVIMFLFTVLLVFVGGIAFYGFLSGYSLEVAKAFRERSDISQIEVFANYRQRIERGIRVQVATMVYSIPFFIGLGIFVSISIFVGGTSGEASSDMNGFSFILMMFAWVIYMFGVFYQMLVSWFITPVITAQYIKTLSFKSMLDFSTIFGFFKKYKKEILVTAVFLFVVNTLISTIITFSLFSIFLLVGLVLFPIAFAITSVYHLHMQAQLVANLSEVFDQE